MADSVTSVLLSAAQVAEGYRVVAELYPDIPPMVIWRAWEYAAYRSRALAEPVLDVGCGDGRFFRCVWPSIANVTGVDINVGTADAAVRSGVYREVHAAPIQRAPIAPASFGSAFANCSLEHMDDLPAVLDAIATSLRPGGELLCSVVTDNLVRWSSLPLLLSAAGAAAVAQRIQADYDSYHHYVNVLTVDDWIEQIESAGFEVLEHVPILPLVTAHVFLLLDQAWHLPQRDGELGNALQEFCKGIAGFPGGLVEALCGILKMESDCGAGCGAVFLARRRAGPPRARARPDLDAQSRRERDTAPSLMAQRNALFCRLADLETQEIQGAHDRLARELQEVRAELEQTRAILEPVARHRLYRLLRC